MQFVYLHLKANKGNVNPETGLFTPLRELSKLSVPTLPNITFYYNTQAGNGLMGIYDLYYFTIKPNAATSTFPEISATKYGDVFKLVGIIRYPLILLQKRGDMSWPGNGTGPCHTHCLVNTCGFGKFLHQWVSVLFAESMQVSFEISVFGCVCAVIICLCSIFLCRLVNNVSTQLLNILVKFNTNPCISIPESWYS